jgi:hypothetical protein
MFKKSKFGSIFFIKEVRFLYSKGGTEKCLGILVRCTISCGLRSFYKSQTRSVKQEGQSWEEG